ncbi:MAG: signal peptidase I [Actinobacteria bacterium]|nr:MAG: signal peptidase I [Actinomycetota bacterium]
MRAVLRRVALAVAAVALAAFAPTHRVMLVGGGSMAPALEAGDVAIVRKGADAHTGDVILFGREGYGRVLHRVVAMHADGTLATRGDANPSTDREPLARGAVEGRVVAVVAAGKARRWVSASVQDAARVCARILPQSHSDRQ